MSKIYIRLEGWVNILQEFGVQVIVMFMQQFDSDIKCNLTSRVIIQSQS